MKEIGLILKQAREAQGKSLEDISAQTKIQLPLLQSLESGEFGRVTNKAFLKGFLRQYARALNLNADELLTTYDRSLAGTPDPKPAPVSKLDSNELTDKTNLLWFRAPSQFITLGAVVIILVLITSIYFISMKIVSYSQETMTTNSATSLPETSETPVEPLLETQSLPTPQQPSSETENVSTNTPAPAAPINAADVIDEDEESEKPSTPPTKGVSTTVENRQKMVTVEARKDVSIEAAWSTGKKETIKLTGNSKHVFYYLEKIKIVIDDGGAIKIQTHEKNLGIPGEAGKPITVNFQ